MLFLAKNYNWEIAPLNYAYEQCIKHNLNYKFKLKDKNFKSTEGLFLGYVECVWEIDYFSVAGVILNRNGVLIKKEELLKIEPYKGDFIYYCNCKWDDNYNFSLYAKDGRRWSISIMSIV